MLESLRKYLESSAGKSVGLVLAIVFIGLTGYFIYTSVGQNEAERASTDRVFIDSTTGKQFYYTIKIGDTFPITAPTGGKTGYPAEPCFWTKDGKIKDAPTYVLVKQVIGKAGPTFCPDCGRLVVSPNPPPMQGQKAPPTEDEYNANHSR